jgi:hypothetical protein
MAERVCPDVSSLWRYEGLLRGVSWTLPPFGVTKGSEGFSRTLPLCGGTKGSEGFTVLPYVDGEVGIVRYYIPKGTYIRTR